MRGVEVHRASNMDFVKSKSLKFKMDNKLKSLMLYFFNNLHAMPKSLLAMP
jgi:hypothetical protein